MEAILLPTRPDPPDSAAVSRDSSLAAVLAGLLARPQQILLLWNWKSAWLSIILRGPIFLAASVRQGFSAAASAVITECVFCALSAGFYGALAQTVKDATPTWLTVLFLAVIVPALFQVVEYLLHRIGQTPHLRVAELVSIAVSAVSSLFNWYAMRRGALLVGGDGRSFGSDLRRLPGLVVNFLAFVPRCLARADKTQDKSGRQGKNPR